MKTTKQAILDSFSDSEQDQIRALIKTKEKGIKEVWKNEKYAIEEKRREMKDMAVELNILSKLSELIDHSKSVAETCQFEGQQNDIVFLSYHEAEAHDANTLSKYLMESGYRSSSEVHSNSESLDSIHVKFWIIFMSNSWQSSEECKFQASVAEINDAMDNSVSILVFINLTYPTPPTHGILSL